MPNKVLYRTITPPVYICTAYILVTRVSVSAHSRSLACSTLNLLIDRHHITMDPLPRQTVLDPNPAPILYILSSHWPHHTALLFLSRIFNVASSILFRRHEHSSKKSHVRHLYASSTHTPSAGLSPLHHLIPLPRYSSMTLSS